VLAVVLIAAFACRSEPRKAPEADTSTSAASAQPSRVCTQKACNAAFTLEAELAFEFKRLRGAKLVVCHNERCSEGLMYDSREPTASSRADFRFQPPSDSSDRARGDVRAHEKAFSLGVYWTAADDNQVQVGDEFCVKLTDRSQNELGSWHRQVDHVQRMAINGEGCPPICQWTTHKDIASGPREAVACERRPQ
jgi:hypothetical protein